MTGSVSHDLLEETIEAKARWFRSLSLEERMEVFCQLTNLVLENNPEIINTRASGREVDQAGVRILELANSKTSAEE